MKKTITKLLKQYPVTAIESTLVGIFISENRLSVSKNKILKEILAAAGAESEEIRREIIGKVDWSSVESLMNVFELLIPTVDKKLNGAFFTPQKITDFMASEILSKADQKICDPSCGCGAFLIASAKFLKKKYDISIISAVEHHLYGVDISDYSIKRAKILLLLLALQHGEEVEEVAFNLQINNSLKADWSTLFHDGVAQFDVVLGNPPYVKFQDLPDSVREDLFNEWSTLKKGSYNLYFAFFELGVRLLKDDGALAFITPNNYFTSLAGETLRQYLHTRGLVKRIIDFNHLLLFDVQTYTCITFIDKNFKETLHYERVDSYDDLSKLKNLKYSAVPLDCLNDKKWRLLRERDFENIRKIENDFTPLGEVVDIRVGVATCKDSVYFLDGRSLKNGKYQKNYGGKTFLIEEGITRRISKISDFKSKEDLDDNQRRIIFPYKIEDSVVKLIDEKDLEMMFPGAFSYLSSARRELARRDKGKVKYPAWYAYARTQGLNHFGEKLLTPTFSAHPRFLHDSDESSLFLNGYALFKKKELKSHSVLGEGGLDLSVLQKILNSAVMQYYITSTSVSISGGYPCYQKNFIENFGIPHFEKKETEYLHSETDKKKIDKFLFKKYGLRVG